MHVSVIASTQVHADRIEKHATHAMELHPDASDGASVVEYAGRLCYGSFRRPNPETATILGYVRNILKQGHGSVLEHATATLLITGVSRSLTHELIRHRHLSFSELSQRFVNMEDAHIVVPPALVKDKNAGTFLSDAFEQTVGWYNQIVERLKPNTDLKRKQVREAARAVLPNMTETQIVVTGNARAWRHFLKMRGAAAADAEINQLAREIFEQLRWVWPELVQDFSLNEDGTALVTEFGDV